MIGYIVLLVIVLLMVGAVVVQRSLLNEKVQYIDALTTEVAKYEMNIMVLQEAQYGKKMRAKERDEYLTKIEEANTDEDIDTLFAELVARNNNRV